MKIYVVLLSVFLFSVRCPGQVKYDTVPCIMLVSRDASKDTCGSSGQIGWCNYPLWEDNAYPKRGYEVRQVDSVYGVVHDPNYYYGNTSTSMGLQMGYIPTYQHFAYLDADKHPLTLFVWMSKQIQ